MDDMPFFISFSLLLLRFLYCRDNQCFHHVISGGVGMHCLRRIFRVHAALVRCQQGSEVIHILYAVLLGISLHASVEAAYFSMASVTDGRHPKFLAGRVDVSITLILCARASSTIVSMLP